MIDNHWPMPTNTQSSSVEPLRAKLGDADDRIRLNHWMPPQQGIAPRIRIGQRWINRLWGLPIAAAALLCLIAIAQSLREIPGIEAFIQQHPGIAQAAPSVDSGFPWWLQLQHFLNMFFMLFIMRAGLQILADHPRLYWGRDCTPGTDWFRFQGSGAKGARLDRQGRFRHLTDIEFVRDFADLGAGHGGYNEDHEFYGYRMPI